MAIQWRGPVPASNYTVGRDGSSVDLIVDHWTVVMFEGAIRRFLNPASILSAHYVIGSDGRIAQMVSEDDTAYHAGVFSVNQRSIGIEHEAGPAMPPSDALYAASARLHADMVITPRVEGVRLMDWGAIERIRDLGRRAASEALTADPNLPGRLGI